MKFKNLNQQEFPLKIIEDLGNISIRAGGKKERYAMFLCPICKVPYRAGVYSVKNLSSTKCRKCSDKYAVNKHGKTGTRLYRIWANMKDRCSNKKNSNFKYYGGKGVFVCNEWEKSFIEFYKWSLINGYSDDLSIDRVSSNGNYEPSNCRWANSFTQNRNTALQKNNKSGFRGVCFHKNSKKWRVTITAGNKQKSLGYFIKKIDAAKAYNSYVIENNLEHTLNTIGVQNEN